MTPSFLLSPFSRILCSAVEVAIKRKRNLSFWFEEEEEERAEGRETERSWGKRKERPEVRPVSGGLLPGGFVLLALM